MRILILEQDAALGVYLKKGLTLEGHDVKWTGSPEELLEMAESGAPDLMVLDISAEGAIDLLAVHQLQRQTAVLTLARSNAVEDRIRCLDLGADDCMGKPFSFHELMARCRALLRRQERSGQVVLVQGSLALNRISRSVSLAGQPVSFTVKEFRLLEFLLQNAGRCCSRSELLTEVFDLSAQNATNVVDVYINYLRKKLSFGVDLPVITTVRGAGYCLVRADRKGVGSVRAATNMHASA